MDAALALIRTDGYKSLTIEGIAARAGVAKTTVYRSWPSKAAVVMDAIYATSGTRLAFPGTGSVRDALRHQMTRLVEVFTDPDFVGPYVGLLSECQHDPALAQELRRRLIAPRRAAVVELLRSGVEQGELRGDLEVEAAIDGLYGALYYRLLVSHEPLTEPYVETIIEQALDGIGAPSANA